jgi:hypothetical protein
MTMRSRRLRVGFIGVVAAALAGCGGTDRVDTENNNTQVSGEAVATALQQQLAKEGVSGAKVSCAKTIIVNVGPRVTCTLGTGAGGTATSAASSSGGGASSTSANEPVTFTFKTLGGKIDLSSVKGS